MKIIFSIAFLSMIQMASASNIRYEWPLVNGLAVNNACFTASTFRSIKPIEYCSDLRVVSRQACRMGGEAEICRYIKENGKLYPGEYLVEQKSCYQTSGRDVEVSRMVTASKCVKWTPTTEMDIGQCLKTETTTYKVGTQFKVAMWENGPQGPKNYLGEMDFTVPACSVTP